jgi:hypothetical protein
MAASVLTTGIAYKGSDQGVIVCIGANVSDKPIETMTVSLINTSGAVLGACLSWRSHPIEVLVPMHNPDREVAGPVGGSHRSRMSGRAPAIAVS